MDGVFNDGVFYDGVFYDGVFYDGVFYDGVFYDGVFYDGVFWVQSGNLVLISIYIFVCLMFICPNIFEKTGKHYKVCS